MGPRWPVGIGLVIILSLILPSTFVRVALSRYGETGMRHNGLPSQRSEVCLAEASQAPASVKLVGPPGFEPGTGRL